jgi:hypothetical protein
MESPYEVPASAARIGGLLRIASTQVHRSLPGGENTERLGLTADSPRLTLDGLVLTFGDVDPVAGHRYVAIGDQVHLIGDGFRHHLIAGAPAYVDPALLPPDFDAGTGTLNGAPLQPEQLAELSGLSAESVEPLGSELSGRLLSLTSEDGSASLRFLVSEDGRSWSRLDLRLRYLLKAPPEWAAVEAQPAPDAGGTQSQAPAR